MSLWWWQELLESCQSAIGSVTFHLVVRPNFCPQKPQRIMSRWHTLSKGDSVHLWFNNPGYQLVCGVSDLKWYMELVVCAYIFLICNGHATSCIGSRTWSYAPLYILMHMGGNKVFIQHSRKTKTSNLLWNHFFKNMQNVLCFKDVACVFDM